MKIAVTLGDDADKDLLMAFTGNPETILKPNDTRFLSRLIRPYTDGCCFDPEDYEYACSFWELYDRKRNESALSAIIANYPCVWENAKKMKALLLDYYPEDKLTRNLILSSVEEQIPHDIASLEICTKSEVYARLLSIIICIMCFALAMGAKLLYKSMQYAFILKLSVVAIRLTVIFAIAILGEWFLSNRIYKGIKYFIRYIIVKNNLELQMIDVSFDSGCR